MQEVFKAYSGKLNRCCCGCSGKYSYTKAGQEYGSTDRGYPVSDDEVSDRSVKIITKKVLSNPNVVFEGSMAYVEDKERNRLLFVMFKKDR